MGVKWDHCALESPYFYVDTEIYYFHLCLWNISEWASPPPSIWHPPARPLSSTAYFDYHSIFMRELVCSSLAFLQRILHSTEKSLNLSSLCLKILCWFPVVLSLRPSHRRGDEGPSSCLKYPAATSFIYVSSLQASSLQCDPPSPKQSLSTLSLILTRNWVLSWAQGQQGHWEQDQQHLGRSSGFALSSVLGGTRELPL